jgi:hypothetical protein
MIKVLKKLEIEGICLNIIKATYDRLLANIILNGEKLKEFPPKSGMRQNVHKHHSYSIQCLNY